MQCVIGQLYIIYDRKSLVSQNISCPVTGEKLVNLRNTCGPYSRISSYKEYTAKNIVSACHITNSQENILYLYFHSGNTVWIQGIQHFANITIARMPNAHAK